MSNIYIMDNTIEKDTTNIVNEANVDNLPQETQEESNELSREDQLVADIFTLQNGVYLGIFVIIFGFTYIYMKKGKSGASIDTRMVDFIVFGLIIVAILAFYLQNRDVFFTESYWKSQTDDFLEYLDNDYSFISNILILLGLYLVIYVFGISMTKEDKPISIRILEGILIGLIVVTGFVVFFKYVLGIDLMDIITDVGSELSGENKEESSDKESEVKAGPAKEVFNIGNNNYTYKEAQAVCSVFDAEVATFDQVENAYNNGGEWCNYGWTQGQMALFPTQKSSWKKLQDFPKHKHDCGRPGINGGYFKNPYLKFGVNCYGVKPDGSDNDLNRMDANRTTPYPKSPEDKETDKKVEEWKKNKDKMLVNSFNKTIWSKY
jgi:hypothetical protein